ncbi:hypothetical protein PQH03_28280 [Ralstonia insidiosa]|jgi:hypothetical protein|nr:MULTISPECIES: hypothetical protein [Ralstonia]MDE4928547.1 hypothetical protein [Ralstonia insidiosa]UNK04018.1 hypothetical protein MMB19_29615 [Ralstonia insidiosa]
MERLAFINAEDAHAATIPFSPILAAFGHRFRTFFTKHQFGKRQHLEVRW